jgi:hypothetical protein
MQLGIVRLVLAHVRATFSGGEDEITIDIYTDRCFDRAGLSLRFRRRQSTTVFEN